MLFLIFIISLGKEDRRCEEEGVGAEVRRKEDRRNVKRKADRRNVNRKADKKNVKRKEG